jgi:hypothetical protein
MTDITAFPTIVTRVRVHGNNAITFIAAETIKAGMVTCINNDGKVVAGDHDDGYHVIGVADTNAATNEEVTINTAGTVCYVANEDDTTAIGEGVTLAVADVNVGGAVRALQGGADTDEYVVGLSLTDISGGGWGLCLINPASSNTA